MSLRIEYYFIKNFMTQIVKITVPVHRILIIFSDIERLLIEHLY